MIASRALLTSRREALLTVSGLASSLLTIIDDILDISKSTSAGFDRTILTPRSRSRAHDDRDDSLFLADRRL